MNMILFAQVTPSPDPSIAWNVVLTLGVLFAIGVNVITLIRMNNTQKRDVTITQSAVPDAAFQNHVAENKREHENIFSKLGGMERGMRAELKEEVTSLRTDLTNAHSELSSQMARTFQDMERAIGRVEGKLEE